MRNKLLFITVLLLSVTLITGCSLTKNEPKEAKEKNVVITNEDMKIFTTAAEAVFKVEKEKLTMNDLTAKEKGSIATSLPEINMYESSGPQMIETFQKYFGKDQKVEFGDIKCGDDHGSEEANIMLIYDKEKEKYVYNDKHPGHGGGGIKFVGHELTFDSVVVKGDTVEFKEKVLFYYPGLCHDIGPCEYGKAYKTYTDAKNETNPLTDIDNNDKYTKTDYLTDMKMAEIDKVVEDYRNDLVTYTFTFVKEDGHYIFKEYHK